MDVPFHAHILIAQVTYPHHTGVSGYSSELEPFVHSIALQLECESLLDSMDNMGNDVTGQRLLSQPPQWFASRRRQSLVPLDYAEMCTQMRTMLRKASARRPLIIAIDGAELLHVRDTAFSNESAPFQRTFVGDPAAVLPRLLQWLPLSSRDANSAKLPPYVRVVIAYNAERSDVKELMQQLVAKDAATVLSVKPLQEEDNICARLLDKLNTAHRESSGVALTEAQLYSLHPVRRSAEEQMLMESQQPRRAKLRLYPLSLWLSFKVLVASVMQVCDGRSMLGREESEQDATRRSGMLRLVDLTSPLDVCEAFLQHVLKRNQKDAVLKCLALLCCAREGLAEDELLDMLSGAAPLCRSYGDDAALPGDVPPSNASPHSTGKFAHGEMAAQPDWILRAPDMPQLDALRLISELEPVLRKKRSDDAWVLCYAHDDFKLAAEKLACPSDLARRRAHLVIAAYFSGRDKVWSWLGASAAQNPDAQVRARR